MSNKKGLKRGLEHLFDQNNTLLDDEINNDEKKFLLVDLREIKVNPYQPRKNFDDESLVELSKSIEKNGIFQPILVRKSLGGYEIISGERRFRAAQKIKLEQIPVIVYDYTDEQMMEVALLENIQRENLGVVEEARAYQKLMDELNYTQEDLSEKISKSRSHIANLLRLLNLDDKILNSLDKNTISLGHAKILVGVKEIEIQKKIFKEIINKNLSVRATEEYLKKLSHEKNKINKNVKQDIESNHNKFESLIEKKLKAKVNISGKNNGIIKIQYMNEEDLTRLLELFKLL